MSEIDSTTPIVAVVDGEPTTTSLIVAEGTSNQHKNVRELIEDHLTDFEEFGRVRFETAKPSEHGGRPSKYAVLTEEHATLLITYLRNSEIVRDFKKRLVREFWQMRRGQITQSPEQQMALGLMAAQKMLEAKDERIAELAEKIATDAPAVNYVELYVAEGDLLKLRVVAANNNVGEQWLRDLLVDKGWIYVETDSRWSNSKGCKEVIRRYSAYSHKRPYFRPQPVHEAPRFKGEPMHTLKVTPAGAEAIARLVAKAVAA